MKSTLQSTEKLQLTIILLVYVIFALIFGFAYRYAINPDGVAQLRLAGYIAEGNFQQSISPAWSPLFTWLMSPFLVLGYKGLTAARIVIALSGLGFLLSSWLLASRFDLSKNVRFIAVMIAALLISDWSIRNIGADLLVATMIMFYLYVVTHPNILNNRKIAFCCGIVGGFSYLAHHYALPFFLVHFPVILFIKGYSDRHKERFQLNKILVAWGTGVVGFLIISSLWIAVMSVKHGQFIISSKGNKAHAHMGPSDIDRRPQYIYGGLHMLKDDYSLHVIEDPSGVDLKTWSPFESKEYFIHQLRLIRINLVYIFNHFVNNSPFFTYAFIVGILAIIPIAFLLSPSSPVKKFLYVWIVVTFSIYCSGFILIIARSPRRFYALMIIFLFLSMHFLEELKNSIGDIVTDRNKKLITYYFLMIIVFAFTIKPGMHLFKSLKNIIATEQVNPYEEIAEQINTIQFQSPYGLIRSSQKVYTDLYLAYYLEKQFLGRLLSKDIEGITEELRVVDAKSLVVFDNLDIVELLKNDERYLHIGSRKLDGNDRYEHVVNINIRDFEIVTGWDKDVNIFELK